MHSPTPALTYPHSRKDPVLDLMHGVPVPDPYRWLEDSDSPDTRAWIEAQNTLTEGFLSQIPAREPLKARLRALWDFPRVGLPGRKGERWFWFRNEGLQNQPVLYVGDGPYQNGRVLLDPNTLSKDGSVSVAGTWLSRDGQRLIYAISDAGTDWRVLRVRDVGSGEDLPDQIRWVKFSDPAWTADGAGFFYAAYEPPQGDERLESINLNQRLYYHRLGDAQAQDRLVYARPDHPDWGFGPELTEDGHTLVVTVWVGTEPRNRVFVLDLDSPDAELRPLLVDFDALYQFITDHEGWLLFRTDSQAPRGRVLAVNLRDPSQREQRIAEQDDALLSVSAVGGELFTVHLHHACARVQRWSPQGEAKAAPTLPGPGTVVGFGGERDHTETWYGFTSFTTPLDIYRLDLRTGLSERVLASPGGMDPDTVQLRQEMVRSKDGTTLPMFIASRKDLPLDGQNPTLLYGYGGFGIPVTPFFSVANRVWMELGGVLAVPNLRGGGEYGQPWHDAGRLANKQNTFDDCHAAAEHLIAQGWTRSPKLAVCGRSNGGLLVGAVITQRPDLYGAALPGVGVLDMLRFHRFTIGWAWVSDYGSADDPEQFQVLWRYSPLHRVQPGLAYPATLVTTGDHDDRVVPGHSFKFAAALQAAQAGPAPVLIRVETRAGHGAGKPTSQVLEEWADCWSFLVATLGIPLPPSFAPSTVPGA